jgi:hypothetical protein
MGGILTNKLIFILQKAREIFIHGRHIRATATT